jgi:hypothetical protein
LCLLLAACDQSSSPSAEEDHELNEAANMLDEAPATLKTVDEEPQAPSSN